MQASAQEIMNAIHSGEMKGLLSMCFNPLVFAAGSANFSAEALSKLEYCGELFFIFHVGPADVLLAGVAL